MTIVAAPAVVVPRGQAEPETKPATDWLATLILYMPLIGVTFLAKFAFIINGSEIIIGVPVILGALLLGIRQGRRMIPALRALLLLAAFAFLPVGARAQDVNPGPDNILRFTKARWSMINPDKDYEGGCVVGFLAFEFSQTGYFSYNNHIRGSWRIDELGNLKLRTRDGIRFTMIVDGGTIRPSQTIEFLKRSDVFQRCPE